MRLFLLCLCFLVVWTKVDCYKVLGVARSATQGQVKKAFRKLARKYHPDKVDESKKERAQKKFSRLGTCYETLSDSEKRKMYDVTGGDPSKQDNTGAGGGKFNFNSFNFDDIFGNFGGFSGGFGAGGNRHGGNKQRQGGFSSFGGNMGDMFGNQGGRQQRQQPELKKEQPPVVVKIALEELMNAPFVAQAENKKKVRIPKGSYNEQIITKGSRKYKLEVQPHDNYFPRKKYDIEYVHTITLTEALTGVVAFIPTIDGRRFKFDSKGKMIKPSSWKKYPGGGLPRSDNRGKGDLVVKFEIEFPTSINADQKRWIKSENFQFASKLKDEL